MAKGRPVEELLLASDCVDAEVRRALSSAGTRHSRSLPPISVSMMRACSCSFAPDAFRSVPSKTKPNQKISNTLSIRHHFNVD